MGPLRISFVAQVGLAAAIGFAGIVALGSGDMITGAANSLLGPSVAPECTIKGNISINTGERIYHVPGQKYYAATRISTEHGERWFCSEAEARAAGWRKAQV